MGIRGRRALRAVGRALSGIAWVLAGITPSAAADAEVSGWAVLRGGNAPEIEARARAVERVLVAANRRVLDRAFVEDRLRALGSRVAAPLGEPELERLHRDAEQTLEDVAFGRYEAAVARGEAALEGLSGKLARLRHHPRGRSDVENLCLYVARALLRSAESQANARARHCLRIAPGLNPDAALHPPRVIELLSREREALASSPGKLGVLEIRVPEGVSRPLEVHLQGRLSLLTGEARVVVRSVAGPTEVQLSCPDGSTLARTLELGPTPQTLTFDPLEGRAFVAGSPLDAPSGEASASSAARWLGASHAIRLRIRDARLELERLDWKGDELRVAASRRVNPSDEAALSRAARELTGEPAAPTGRESPVSSGSTPRPGSP